MIDKIKKKEYDAKHYREIKEFKLQQNREWRARYPWYDSWRDARRRCQDPRNKNYISYSSRGIKFCLTKIECSNLWERDEAHKMLRPSIDRIDSEGSYTYENCRFIELQKNIEQRWED